MYSILLKKTIIKLLVLLVILIALVVIIPKNRVLVEIENSTENIISNFTFKINGSGVNSSDSIDDTVYVYEIKPSKNVKIKIKTDMISEGELKLFYKNSLNEVEEFTVIGYFEKGYTERIGLIVSVEDNDLKINFKVK